MAEFNILETFEMVGKAKTREEKRQVLKDRENFATKALLQLNYHPDVKWHLPPGAPPPAERRSTLRTGSRGPVRDVVSRADRVRVA